MSWKITFFDHKVESAALEFPAGVLANFLYILEMIEDFGPALGKPHTAPMGAGLFEIRAKELGVHSFVLSKAKRSSFSIPSSKRRSVRPKRNLRRLVVE